MLTTPRSYVVGITLIMTQMPVGKQKCSMQKSPMITQHYCGLRFAISRKLRVEILAGFKKSKKNLTVVFSADLQKVFVVDEASVAVA